MRKNRSAASPRRGTVSSRPETLVTLLRERALVQPEMRMYHLVGDVPGEARSLTVGELDRYARDIGARLQALGAQGSRAILLLPSGLEFVIGYFGCLYGGAVAVPLPPPEEGSGVDRIRAVARDAGARFILTSSSLYERTAASLGSAELTVLAPFGSENRSPDDWAPPLLDPAVPAHLQYTSTPEGAPRGVMLSHRNLLHNSEVIRKGLNVAAEDRILSWTGPHHELGLMLGLLQPLYTGCSAFLINPTDVLREPQRWLEAISEHRVTITGAPNFAYDLCVHRTSDQQRADFDLRSWRLALIGPDAAQPRTLTGFGDAFSPCGFDPIGYFPFYALVEATLLVTGGGRPTAPVVGAFDPQELELGRARLVSARSGRLLASRGQPRPGQQVRIVDPEDGHIRAPGEVGEVWVGGPSVSAGYWRRRADTMERFGAFVRDTGEGPFMRTGDLGFLLGGELFVTGRLHDCICLEGTRLTPEEIEDVAAASHQALVPGGGAAFTVPFRGSEALVLVHEIHQEPVAAVRDPAIAKAVRAAIRRSLGLSTLEVVLLPAASLPRSPLGTVRRAECRQGYLEGRLRGPKVASDAGSDAGPNGSLRRVLSSR